MGPKIELKNVCLIPTGFEEATLVDQSCTIESGEIVVLMGGSGCGKTTFLRALARLLKPTQGVVCITDQGRQIKEDICDFVGFMYQDPISGIFPWKHVRQNLEFPRRLRDSNAYLKDWGDDWLKRLGLPKSAEKHPTGLSGGERKRLLFGMVLSYEPTLLLLDEPFTGLDFDLAAKLWQELFEYHWISKATVVMVTHSVREAAVLADRVMILDETAVFNGPAIRADGFRRPARATDKMAVRLEDEDVIKYQKSIQQELNRLLLHMPHMPGEAHAKT